MFLIPLGMITASVIVIDPSFVAYEFLPEELLLIPWLFCSIIISFSNTRSAYLIGTSETPFTSFYIKTFIYFVEVSERFDSDEFPGRKLCYSIHDFLKSNIYDYIISTPLHEDDSWSFFISNDNFCTISVSIYFLGNEDENPHIEEFEISIQYTPPLNPLKRLKFTPDHILMKQIKDKVVEFMFKNKINYSIE